MTEPTIESLAKRLAAIEQRLGIEPEPQPEPMPPMMSYPRSGHQIYDPAQQLRDRIAGFEAELAEWEGKIAVFERGEDPAFPQGPGGRFSPNYAEQAEVCRFNIRSFEERLSMMSGNARPITERR